MDMLHTPDFLILRYCVLRRFQVFCPSPASNFISSSHGNRAVQDFVHYTKAPAHTDFSEVLQWLKLQYSNKVGGYGMSVCGVRSSSSTKERKRRRESDGERSIFLGTNTTKYLRNARSGSKH